MGVWYPSGTGDGGLKSPEASVSGLSLCPALSAADVEC